MSGRVGPEARGGSELARTVVPATVDDDDRRDRIDLAVVDWYSDPVDHLVQLIQPVR